MRIAEAAIKGIWDEIGQIDPATRFDTPAVKAWFRVAEVDRDGLTISTSGDSRVRIRKDAFESALAYLLSNGHAQASPCEIRSNLVYDDAGPLCQATRTENGTMTITYVLPILETMGLVGIDPGAPRKPSTTWFIA